MIIELDKEACERVRAVTREAKESGAAPTAAQMRTIFTDEQIAEIVDSVKGYGQTFEKICEAVAADWLGGDDEEELLETLDSFFDEAGVAFVRHG